MCTAPKSVSLLLVIGTFLFPFSALASFDRDLFLGSTGEDVYELQQILNQRPETQVAEAGPGSPGYETVYFGGQTEGAVVRYQEFFAQEILVPAGLSSGTGYVGASTRARLTQDETSTTTRRNAPGVVVYSNMATVRGSQGGGLSTTSTSTTFTQGTLTGSTAASSGGGSGGGNDTKSMTLAAVQACLMLYAAYGQFFPGLLPTFMHLCVTFYSEWFAETISNMNIGPGDSQKEIDEKIQKYIKNLAANGCTF